MPTTDPSTIAKTAQAVDAAYKTLVAEAEALRRLIAPNANPDMPPAIMHLRGDLDTAIHDISVAGSVLNVTRRVENIEGVGR